MVHLFYKIKTKNVLMFIFKQSHKLARDQNFPNFHFSSIFVIVFVLVSNSLFVSNM